MTGMKNFWAMWQNGFHEIMVDVGIMVLLLICCVAGVAFTDAFEEFSHLYWLSMVPVFFGACVYLEWADYRRHGEGLARILFNQVLHWLGLFVAVNIVYLLRRIGSLDNATTGLSLLLVFALGTYSAGFASRLMFRLLGVMLAISLILVAYTEHYIWVTLGLAAIIALVYAIALGRTRATNRG